MWQCFKDAHNHVRRHGAHTGFVDSHFCIVLWLVSVVVLDLSACDYTVTLTLMFKVIGDATYSHRNRNINYICWHLVLFALCCQAVVTVTFHSLTRKKGVEVGRLCRGLWKHWGSYWWFGKCLSCRDDVNVLKQVPWVWGGKWQDRQKPAYIPVRTSHLLSAGGTDG